MSIKKFFTIVWSLWFISFFCFFAFTTFAVFKDKTITKKINNEYFLPWPGILPDSKLYKLKVLRNKITEKIIVGYPKKAEFDLLMADKTIYASKLLFDKGEFALAKETVLKGENYFSLLVQNYNNALLDHKKISSSLDRQIDLAVLKHREVLRYMEKKASEKDKETFQVVYKFSQINYQFIVGLRSPRK